VNGPDGFHYMDKAWGDGGGWGGGSVPQGYAMSGSTSGNTQIITISRSVASATTVSASSDQGSITASVASAQSESVTFAIDFSTGTITAMDTQQSINEASVSQSAPSPRLSLQASGVS